MNFHGQSPHRALSILFLLTVLTRPCYSWHRTLTFAHQLSYETDEKFSPMLANMKFFMWHRSYAIYGARETLILLQPTANTSSIEAYTYKWPVDSATMDECLQEWNTKEKCYNDVVHVRNLPHSTLMDVYCTYALRPMVRSFDWHSMSFVNSSTLTRDPHPPMDSERSYVMLTFNTSLVTAGYQGDYIPTIRASQGKTLLYALRQNSYFIGGFKYDGKAVFGVIETSERTETNRVSRLVMACANRAEIIRKATLNCSTDMFDQSRSFVFHILTSVVDPIRTKNGSVLLFATFTTSNSSITASAVCLFVLDKQFYDVFTASSMRTSRTNEMNELIVNCSQSIASTIDRDTVESGKQFVPYLSNPLLMETMSKQTFSAIDVIPYGPDLYCLIIGTSDGHLFTAFTHAAFETKTFEELTFSISARYPIRSITHKKTDNNSYVVIFTNQIGYSVVKLVRCEENGTKLCFRCFVKNCSIRRDIAADKQSWSSGVTTQSIVDNETHILPLSINDQSSSGNRSMIARSSSKKMAKSSLPYIVAPMAFVIFVLFTCIVLLLTKSNAKIKQGRFYPSHSRKTQDSSSKHALVHTYTNNIMYKPNGKPSAERKQQQQDMFLTKSELCVRSITTNPVYSTASSQSLPSLVVPASTEVAPSTPQPLSVRRLCKSYM